jgi:hypothetical protein
MHIDQLMNHLILSYGEPSKLDRQNAYRWEISRGRYPIHLCVTVQDSNDRAVIWVFDPHRTDGHADTIYLNAADKLEEVLNKIENLIPWKGKDGHDGHNGHDGKHGHDGHDGHARQDGQVRHDGQSSQPQRHDGQRA